MPVNPDDLEERIARARAAGTPREAIGPDRAADAANSGALGFGLQAGAQFVAAVVGGGGIGWLIDRWLGTSPFGVLTLTVLCFVAALVNVWLMMSRAVDAATASLASGETTAVKEERDTEEVDGESS